MHSDRPTPLRVDDGHPRRHPKTAGFPSRTGRLEVRLINLDTSAMGVGHRQQERESMAQAGGTYKAFWQPVRWPPRTGHSQDGRARPYFHKGGQLRRVAGAG